MGEQCVKGTENEQRIIALERDVGEIKRDIKDMKEGLLKRPSWTITVIITLLTSLSMASLTFAFTVIKYGT